MMEILTAIITFSGIIGIILGIIWIIRSPVTPDPWDEVINKDDFENNAKPLCPTCAKPIETPRSHYCEHCGELTGEYSRYLPWEGIKFNYAICGTMWKKTCDTHVANSIRTLNFILLLIIAPILLVAALVVKLLKFYKSKKEQC